MGKNTARDRVYDVLLRDIFQDGADARRVEYVADRASVSESTVRDVFKTVPYLESKKLPTNEVVYVVDRDWFGLP